MSADKTTDGILRLLRFFAAKKINCFVSRALGRDGLTGGIAA
jgi:hypothetical protein